jgi:hypothetical protein
MAASGETFSAESLALATVKEPSDGCVTLTGLAQLNTVAGDPQGGRFQRQKTRLRAPRVSGLSPVPERREAELSALKVCSSSEKPGRLYRPAGRVRTDPENRAVDNDYLISRRSMIGMRQQRRDSSSSHRARSVHALSEGVCGVKYVLGTGSQQGPSHDNGHA